MFNRRQFLKAGLSGLFGAFLTWGGAVKAEKENDQLFDYTFIPVPKETFSLFADEDHRIVLRPLEELDDPLSRLERSLIAELSEATKVKIAIDFEASWNSPELIYMARAVFYSNLVGKECMAFCDFPDELLHSVETPVLTDIIAHQLRQVFRDGELERLVNANPA